MKEPYKGQFSNVLETNLLSIERSDMEVWRTMDFHSNQEKFLQGRGVISNGQAMEVSAVWCKEALTQLTIDLAGKHGPVSDLSIHDQMCNAFCITNDILREEAMTTSECNCLQLSTKTSDLSYTKTGDWCLKNSGRILCSELGRCGIWECALEDFHCPRRDYNQKEVPLKGFGDNCSYGPMLRPDLIMMFIFGFLSIAIMI